MPLPEKIILCQYRYDALNWLVSHLSLGAPQHQRFYCKSRLATEIQGAVRHSIFQQDDSLLAQQQSGDGEIDTSLLATDQQRSVLHTLSDNHQRQVITYSPYGHRSSENGLLGLLGFNGERPDPVTGYYLLGNGYRAFNPVLMRFNSPDTWSPFGKGGINSYVYCLADPINRSDPNGHFPGMVGPTSLLKLTNKLATKLTRSTPSKNPHQVIKNQTLSQFKKLTNLQPDDITNEYSFFNKAQQTQSESLIKTISSRQNLTSLNENTTYKFVFTDQGQFITAAPYKHTFSDGRIHQSEAATHAVLSQFAGTPRIISAGQMRLNSTQNIDISNWAGHYWPEFDSLTPATDFLRKLNFQVRTIDINSPNYLNMFFGI